MEDLVPHLNHLPLFAALCVRLDDPCEILCRVLGLKFKYSQFQDLSKLELT